MNADKEPLKVHIVYMEKCDVCKQSFRRFLNAKTDLLSRAVNIYKALVVRKCAETGEAFNIPKVICFTCCGSRIQSVFNELEQQTEEDIVRIQLELILLCLDGIEWVNQDLKLSALAAARMKQLKQQEQQQQGKE